MHFITESGVQKTYTLSEKGKDMLVVGVPPEELSPKDRTLRVADLGELSLAGCFHDEMPMPEPADTFRDPDTGERLRRLEF